MSSRQGDTIDMAKLVNDDFCSKDTAEREVGWNYVLFEWMFLWMSNGVTCLSRSVLMCFVYYASDNIETKTLKVFYFNAYSLLK